MNNTMTLHAQRVMIDPLEAPEGFVPVPKAAFTRPDNLTGNYCQYCDFRRKAIDKGLPCVCAADKRKDGISVVFKRKVAA